MKIEADNMKTITVHYDNGDRITTRINATVDKIVNIYLDNPIIYDDFETGKETRAYARAVEFLDGVPARKAWGGFYQLRRVYSVSREMMERCDLHSKFRFTAYDFTGFSPIHNRQDAAYIAGMFD